MKTAEEFYNEIKGSKELQNELKAAYLDTLGAFLKKYDCKASAKEFTDYIQSRSEGELDDDDAEKVAGGYPVYPLPI